jgi:thiol-disulfide isomerase/thioredoxin
VSGIAGLHRVGVTTVLVTIFYALGAAVPMLLLAAGGRQVVTRLRANAAGIRVALGVVMALGAVAIYQGWETSLQTKIPSFASSLQNAIEGNDVAKRELADLRGPAPKSAPLPDTAAGSKLGVFGHAPDFSRIANWLNTPHDRPLTIGQLRGKVVLVDFWTYSCINCLRTLPHVEALYKRYHSAGLEVIGVHTPEFAFEHDLGNVRAATHRLGVHYPVALDNDYATWNAYQNNAWPAEYLIDQNGLIRSIDIGEGRYSQRERKVRFLLAAGDHNLPNPVNLPDRTPTGLARVTPETYLGYTRLQGNGGEPIRHDRNATYTPPRRLQESQVAYGGNWFVGGEHAVAGAKASIDLHFFARDVYIVLGGQGTVRTTVDGRAAKTLEVNGYRLYIAFEGKKLRNATLRLRFPPGIRAYSFTFG